MITIDNDIPLASISRESQQKYPWADLEFGASFFVADGPDGKNALPSAAATAQKRFAKPTGQTGINGRGNVREQLELSRRFVTRRREENGVKGVRCWCVQPSDDNKFILA